jgi:hypothetical protein
VSYCCLTQTAIAWREQVNFQINDDVRFVLDQIA